LFPSLKSFPFEIQRRHDDMIYSKPTLPEYSLNIHDFCPAFWSSNSVVQVISVTNDLVVSPVFTIDFGNSFQITGETFTISEKDGLPLSYFNYLPYIRCSIPLKPKEFPDPEEIYLSVSDLAYERNITEDATDLLIGRIKVKNITNSYGLCLFYLSKKKWAIKSGKSYNISVSALPLIKEYLDFTVKYFPFFRATSKNEFIQKVQDIRNSDWHFIRDLFILFERFKKENVQKHN
jgi:hypothetical protein